MKSKDQGLVGRRMLITGMGVAAAAAAAAGLAVSASSASAQNSSGSGFAAKRHSQDSWLGELAGEHRAFVDSSTVAGGENALRYASNILTAHEDDYAGSASDYAMVVCFRHGSTPFAFSDVIWEKYGAAFDSSADPAPTTNPMNVPTGSNGQNSIGSLVERGVYFAICSRATRAFSGILARSTGLPADQVLQELLANPIPNSRFVPAGVVAATRAQEYGYSLLYSA
jgi:intracellular sulfur oxidation DsrE/DsrF family protein